jgi:hypothetical protein
MRALSRAFRVIYRTLSKNKTVGAPRAADKNVALDRAVDARPTRLSRGRATLM